MIDKIVFTKYIISPKIFWSKFILLGFFVLLGFACSLYMEHEGHYVTGMNNQIVWGLPHIFAVLLIVIASGVLNIASISSVFDKKLYKPLAPLSALLAVAFLIAGLIVLVLDLGKPDRLIVAMTTYNFKSIFSWNIFLYSGFAVVLIAYMWTMLDREVNKYSKYIGTFAFGWRIILTTGTGSIFGFLLTAFFTDIPFSLTMFGVGLEGILIFCFCVFTLVIPLFFLFNLSLILISRNPKIMLNTFSAFILLGFWVFSIILIIFMITVGVLDMDLINYNSIFKLIIK